MSGSSSTHGSPAAARAPSSSPAAQPAPREGCATASHEVLFAGGEGERCDVCGASLDDAEARGGSGAYLFARGDEIREEEVPLCLECGTAILATALSRWEIEEEEG